jgi:predicted nucleic acid-binding protein
MNGERVPLFAWDSCVFLAWLNEERDKSLEVIAHLLGEVERSRVTILVSAISGAEILDRAGQSQAGTIFRGFVHRRNVILANVDMRVAEIAARFRQNTIRAHQDGELARSIRAPDALIAATASLYRADALHTFDPDLLALDGSPLVDGLRIVIPNAPSV